MQFNTFASWYGLEHYLEEHNNIVYYQAPLDSQPNIVCVIKRFKNRKLRIAYGPWKFTADEGHLDRFRWVDNTY